MESSKGKLLLKTLLISYLLSTVMLLLLAFLLYKFRLGETQIRGGVYAIYFISCLAGGLIIGKGARQKRFFWGLLSGLFYFMILLAVSLILNRGLKGDSQQTLITLLLCFAAGTLGGMIS